MRVGFVLWISVPPDGVKGKTWGPSTCHQRERGQIPMLRSNPRAGISSVSAPNLIRPRLAITRPAHDIGNANRPPTTADNNNRNGRKLSNGGGSESGGSRDNIFQLVLNKVTAFTHTDFKPFKTTNSSNNMNNSNNNGGRKGSTNNAPAFRNNSYPSSEAQLLARNRLSRSFGNINETHTYDTVFANNSFVIARGVRNNPNYVNTRERSLPRDSRK